MLSIFKLWTTGAQLTIAAALIDESDTTNGNGFLNITGVNFVSANVTGGYKI